MAQLPKRTKTRTYVIVDYSATCPHCGSFERHDVTTIEDRADARGTWLCGSCGHRWQFERYPQLPNESTEK